MNWALKRKIIYISIVALFFLSLLFYFIYPYITKPPTCTDGKQNGEEVGVDCGGTCPLACPFEVDDLVVSWTRTFKVDGGKYNAVAYIENQNKTKAIENIKYRFRFADKDNIFIGSREGQTTVPPEGKFAVFEQAIDLGYSIPHFTTFEFIEKPIWINVNENTKQNLKINITNIKFENNIYIPRLRANIKNNSFFNIPDFNAVAILYDELGNAMSVSNTYFSKIKSEEELVVNYTWRESFPKEPVSIEIIPMFNIFNVRME